MSAFRVFLLSLAHSLLLLLAVFFGILLLLASLAPYINPNSFVLPNLLALCLPWLVLPNLFFLLYWGIRKRYLALIPLLPLLFSFCFTFRHFQPQKQQSLCHELPTADSVRSKPIKILTYNVNLFRLYSWADTPPTFEKIAQAIRETDADIVCLQEFTTTSGRFDERKIRKLFPPHAKIYYTLHQGDLNLGLAIFSRFPILESGLIAFPNSYNASMFADICCDQDTLRVYNNHLQSFRLHRKNIAFIRSPHFSINEDFWSEIQDVLHKLSPTLKKQAQQVATVAQHRTHSPYPVLLCGDFNTTPYTYTYAQMKSELTDAFETLRSGTGATFSSFFPPMRIDYMLHSSTICPTDCRVLRLPYSDHFPLLLSFHMHKK